MADDGQWEGQSGEQVPGAAYATTRAEGHEKNIDQSLSRVAPGQVRRATFCARPGPSPSIVESH